METWPSHRENEVPGAPRSLPLLTCEHRSDALRNRNEPQADESQRGHERDSFPCEIIRPRFLGEIMWDLGVVVMLGDGGTEGLLGLKPKLKAYCWWRLKGFFPFFSPKLDCKRLWCGRYALKCPPRTHTSSPPCCHLRLFVQRTLSL